MSGGTGLKDTGVGTNTVYEISQGLKIIISHS